jgi:hypothetical protein
MIIIIIISVYGANNKQISCLSFREVAGVTEVAAVSAAAGFFVVDADLSCHHDAVALDEDVLITLAGGLDRPLDVGARCVWSRRPVARGKIVIVRTSGLATRGMDLVDGFYEERADRWDAADHEDGPHLSSGRD